MALVSPNHPAPPSNQGIAGTLDEAKAAFKKRYEEVKRHTVDSGERSAFRTLGVGSPTIAGGPLSYMVAACLRLLQDYPHTHIDSPRLNRWGFSFSLRHRVGRDRFREH
jgi:hypothetical protein